jgi:DNA-binding NarL/FixJ family response regulator
MIQPTAFTPRTTDQLPILNVLVVEDQARMQMRLQRLVYAAFPSCSLFCVNSLQAARDMLSVGNFELVLIDLGMPDGNGMELVERLTGQTSAPLAVVITADTDIANALTALRMGASGFLFKNREDAELLAALKSLATGGAALDPQLARHLMAVFSGKSSALTLRPSESVTVESQTTPRQGWDNADLSDKEIAVLSLIAQGLTNSELAEHLDLSVNTIEWHIKNIYRKLQVRRRTQAVDAARLQGYLST